MPILLQAGQAVGLGLQGPVEFPEALSESVPLPAVARGGGANLNAFGLNDLPLA
jgi:hypothetical protein